jgi:hypothetical protein
MSGEVDVTPGISLGAGETVTVAKLNSLGALTPRIAELSVGEREMANGIITSEKLDPSLEAQLGVEDNSVGTNAFVNGAVTGPKVASGQQLAAPLISPLSGTTYKPSVVLVVIPTTINMIPYATAWNYQIPAGLINHAGDCLKVTSIIAPTNIGTGTRTFTYSLGGFPVHTVANSHQDRYHWITMWVVTQTAATTQRFFVSMTLADGTVAAATLNLGLDLTLPKNLQLDMTGTGALDQATHFMSTIEYLPAP